MKNITNYKSAKMLISLTLFALIMLITPPTIGNALEKNLTLNQTTLKQGEILIVKTDASSSISKITFANKTYEFHSTNKSELLGIEIPSFIVA